MSLVSPISSSEIYSFKTPTYSGAWFPFNGDRFLLREQIAEYLRGVLGDSTGQLVVKEEDGPHWMSQTHEIQLSYSHTQGRALLVYSFDHQIGVDAERLDRKVSQSVQALADRFLEAEEAKLVSTREEFLEVWLKKEAYAKLTRLGLAKTLKVALNKIEGVQFARVAASPEGYAGWVALRKAGE